MSQNVTCNILHAIIRFLYFLKQVLASQFLAPPVLAIQGPLIIIVFFFSNMVKICLFWET